MKQSTKFFGVKEATYTLSEKEVIEACRLYIEQRKNKQSVLTGKTENITGVSWQFVDDDEMPVLTPSGFVYVETFQQEPDAA